MKIPTFPEIRRGIAYILINFATPIVFYVVFYGYGTKPAIAFSMGVTGIQLWIHRFYQIKLSPFFILASGFIIGFGTLDLFLETPRFFRLEPCIQNFLVGTVFLASWMARLSIAGWFIGALPRKLQLEFSEATEAYFRKLTLVWVVYLYLKAALFLYFALTVDLGKLMILRSVIGGGSLALMFFGECIYRRYRRTKS